MLACIPLGELFFFHIILIRKVSGREVFCIMFVFQGTLISYKNLEKDILIFGNNYNWGQNASCKFSSILAINQL